MKNYECPRCQIEQLDPYHPVLEFLLSPLLVLPDSRRSFICPKKSPGCHIEIRCLPLERKGFIHQWPAEASIHLDSLPCCSFMPQPANLSRKRKDNPEALHQLTEGAHQIQVLKRKEDTNHALAIVIVQTLTAKEVLSKLHIGALDSSKGQKLVAAYMSDAADVATETLRLSLLCPLTHLKPSVPVRGARCSHLQCFDLQSFVLLQESPKVNRWKCPICKEHCARLIRDLYLEKILQASGQSDVVEFDQKAQYRFMPPLKDEDDSSDAEAVKRENETDGPLPVKRPRLRGDAFTWAEFASGRLGCTEMYSSTLYSNVAGFILRALDRVTGSRQTQEAGSLLTPIVLD